MLVTGVTQDFESVMVYFMLPSPSQGVPPCTPQSRGSNSTDNDKGAELQYSYSSLNPDFVLFACSQEMLANSMFLFVFANVHCKKKQEVNSKNM